MTEVAIDRWRDWICLADSFGSVNAEVPERTIRKHGCMDVAHYWSAGRHINVLPWLLCTAFTEIVIVVSHAVCCYILLCHVPSRGNYAPQRQHYASWRGHCTPWRGVTIQCRSALAKWWINFSVCCVNSFVCSIHRYLLSIKNAGECCLTAWRFGISPQAIRLKFLSPFGRFSCCIY